jgi:hypothetical protein
MHVHGDRFPKRNEVLMEGKPLRTMMVDANNEHGPQ